MVGLRRASTWLLVVLVVMATTIANGACQPAATAPAGAADAATAPAGAAAGSLDVKALGAKGDGTTDDAPAFAAAWKTACAAAGPSTITVPKGEYMVEGIEFTGPCKGPVTLNLNGNLKAPAGVPKSKPHEGWIEFEKIADFTFNGHEAILDGQGAAVWKANNCAQTGSCNNLPINIRFTSLTNSKVIGITSTNSKLFHINILQCSNLTLQDVNIDAPAESLNTDGIHIGRSNGVNLIGGKIRTGDECISVGDGTENLVVENIECGPGHGIAVGSLGRYPNEQPVKGVIVRKCLIKNTNNGVRIKTWPGSPPGIASNILFEDITMDNVSLPILIDQEYCPHGKCNAGVPSMVKLSDVTFSKIKGTSATKIAVKLICSKGAPCTNVALADINLVSTSKEGPTVSAYANMKLVLKGQMIPAACTEIATPGP